MKLDFRFLSHDDILEARVDGGYYHIIGNGNIFHVIAYVAHDLYTVGDFDNIYDALDAANNHYKGI